MKAAIDTLQWIIKWYEAHCDGDWEHQYGLTIETLDNPDWAIKIDLAETELEETVFAGLEVERTDTDWVHCLVENKVFKGAGGPQNLIEILNVFRDWATTHSD